MSYFMGTANLTEELDKKLMVSLRDGRILIGYLRSVDQFANLVMHRTVERVHVGDKFGDMNEESEGCFVIRGENVSFIGEIDEKRDMNNMQRVSMADIMLLQQEQQKIKQRQSQLKQEFWKKAGLNVFDQLIDDNIV